MNYYFATVARGLETLAAQELEELGASHVEPGFCGVSFRGDQKLLYQVNIWARIPFRILVKLYEFPCQDADDLFRGMQRIAWSDYLTPDLTLAVKATGKSKQLNHSHFTALQAKTAIVKQQQAQFNDRSDVDLRSPDVQVNIHIEEDICTVSLDSSGESLHRRGYRPAVGLAPLKESLAAALIQLSGWQPEEMFYDPLCGSGTLPLEAGMKALNIAPGLYREKFAFETWLDADIPLLEQLIQAAEANQKDCLIAPIWGSDGDQAVIQQAQANATQAEIANYIYFSVAELEDVAPPVDHGVVFCNPPYGERLGQEIDLAAFYQRLGNVLKQRFKGWTAYVLSGNKDLSQAIGLKSAQRFPFYNGSLPCQLMKYELY